MEKIFCAVAGQKVSRCLSEIGQVDSKISSRICSGCKHQKESQRIDEIKRWRQNEREQDQQTEDAFAKGVVRFTAGFLPEPKRSHTKLPKEFKVTDRTTGKERRVRYAADHWPRQRFTSTLCSLCDELTKRLRKELYEDTGQEPLSLSREGKESFLKMSIAEITQYPEMKEFRRFTSRMLSAWRREICSICLKDDPALKIVRGRRKK